MKAEAHLLSEHPQGPHSFSWPKNMITTLLGIKKGMTSTYDARGRRVGATILEVTPNLVTQVKREEGKDGYNAIQVGLGLKKSVKKPQVGHLKKANIEQKVRFLREVRADKADVEAGQAIEVGKVFAKGDEVKVTGTSKGRGFQGGVRRHGFHGGPKTHGQSDRHRAPGSIGSGTTPGRILKGKKMAGHMGAETVTVRGLEVVGVDKKNNLLTIKGGIPGPVGGLVTIQKLGRIKGYTPPPEEKEEEEGEKGQEVGIKGEEVESGNGEVKENTETTESVAVAEGESSFAEATEDKENAGK